MQKENNCFFWVLAVLYELHPPLIEISRAGFEGACASGQPVKWNHCSSYKLGFKVQIWKGSKIFVWIAVPLCYISVLFHSLASGKVFGLQWVFSRLLLCSSEWKLFMRSLYNVGSSSVLRVFWRVWRWGLEDAQYLGTSDATGKLPWIQTIWSGLVAKTTGLHFLAYTPPNFFIDTLRKCLCWCLEDWTGDFPGTLIPVCQLHIKWRLIVPKQQFSFPRAVLLYA